MTLRPESFLCRPVKERVEIFSKYTVFEKILPDLDNAPSNIMEMGLATQCGARPCLPKWSRGHPPNSLKALQICLNGIRTIMCAMRPFVVV